MRIQPIAALLVVSLAGVACKRETAGPAQRGLAEVRTVAAWTGSVERVARAVGQIRAVESVTVAAEVEGTVRVVHFQEGGAVNAGDVLVELDDSRARAELAAAEARRDRAARQMERYEQAATTSAASTTELDTVRTELREADAEYELAKIRVEDHTIEAPFAGRVGLRMVSPGAFIQAGDALTTLTTIDPVEIEFTVPEVFLADLRPGLEVAATSAAFTDRSFRSVVQVVSPQVDPSTRSVLVLAVTPNPDGLLRPGMFVNVRLVLGTRENAVMVPEAAIEFQGSLAMLYTVQGEQAKRRSVKIGERREGTVEVIEGLSEGDVVVTQGLQKIRDGSPVRAVPDADARASTAAEVEGNG
jgi:membrane fusion protein (multidrug efflux system)